MKEKKEFGLTHNEQIELGEKIKLLWSFIYSLKDKRDALKAIADQTEKNANIAVSAAVLNPMGFEVSETKHNRVAKRAKLLVEMLDCLEDTDKNVISAEKEKQNREELGELFNF